jgi:hypothetical protein
MRSSGRALESIGSSEIVKSVQNLKNRHVLQTFCHIFEHINKLGMLWWLYLAKYEATSLKFRYITITLAIVILLAYPTTAFAQIPDPGDWADDLSQDINFAIDGLRYDLLHSFSNDQASHPTLGCGS